MLRILHNSYSAGDVNCASACLPGIAAIGQLTPLQSVVMIKLARRGTADIGTVYGMAVDTDGVQRFIRLLEKVIHRRIDKYESTMQEVSFRAFALVFCVHSNRTFSGDCNHRCAGRLVVARRASSARSCPSHAMQEQSETNWPRHPWISRCKQGSSPRWYFWFR